MLTTQKGGLWGLSVATYSKVWTFSIRLKCVVEARKLRQMIILRSDSPLCHCFFAVMNNPELPLDPNLQTSNLLITFLKYSSIVMQDTKGKISLFPSSILTKT